MPSLARSSGRHRLPSSSPALPPPLKWAGGKRWQLPVLQPLWQRHAHRRLVEPFCGGLAVALGLLPERALVNDINAHLINFYRWLQRGFRVTVRLENNPAVFYTHRTRFNLLLREGRESASEAAALFYYLNRTGYNGLCRFNSRGEFNVPFGQYTRIAYATDFTAYRATLARWQFTTGDFATLQLHPDDFIYADPPYDVEFRKYSKEGFDWDDQVRTAQWCAAHRGAVVLVNQASERICALYAGLGFRLEFLTAPRRINCTGDRTPAREVIATRNI
jgi:DNA adenine methylase